MADTAIRFSPSLLSKFIDLYKKQPCLWNRCNSGYGVETKKEQALEKLLNLVQEHHPNATRETITKKIDSIRSCHRKERAKLERERNKHPKRAHNIKSTLWYYDSMSFLNGKESRRLTYRDSDDESNYLAKETAPSTSVANKQKLEEEDEEEAGENDDPQFEHQSMDNYSADYGLATSMVEVSDSASMQFSNFDESGSSKAKRHRSAIGDEYDAIGINVAAKLRNLPPNMRILAEKLINDVMFQAQLNGLNASTVISTPDPFKQDPL